MTGFPSDTHRCTRHRRAMIRIETLQLWPRKTWYMLSSLAFFVGRLLPGLPPVCHAVLERSIASDESAHFHEVSSHMNAINIREQVFIHGHIWATMVAYGVTSQDLIVVLSQVWGRGVNQNIKILRQVVGHLAKDVVVCSHSALPKRCWLCPSFNIGRGVGKRPKII